MKETTLFQFRLVPIDELLPWGQEEPFLHWFGLSYGWFWMQAGNDELFRYSQESIDQICREYPSYKATLPYEDYQIARYWEDLIEMLPAILSPVPDDLAEEIADAPRWRQWEGAAFDWWEKHDDDASRDIHEIAMTWWNRRTWQAWHLSNPPNMWLWTVGDNVHIRWDNRSVIRDGVSVWEAQAGEFVLPVTEFRAEVLSFDARFIAGMAERLRQVRGGTLDPKIAIDIEALERGQKECSAWMKDAIDRRLQYFSWDEVRAAMTAIF